MEFTKGENKSIEVLKKLQKGIELLNQIAPEKDVDIIAIDIILKLIEKQQKEIEKLKFNNHMVSKWNEYLDKECVSKNKIKAKIKELETLYNCNLDTAMTSYEMFHFVRSYIDKVKNILNELLEDN